MKQTYPPLYRCQRGAALLIMFLIILVGVAAVLLKGLSGNQISLRQREAAVTQLGEVKEALYGFAQANGRLPCPATPASAGRETPAGGGVCTSRHGFVPSVTLGLKGAVNTDGLLLDNWGNPLRYSVTNSNGSAFTTGNGMQTVTVALLTPDLRVCREAACTTVIATAIPVALFSMGKNWTAYTSANELANAGEAGTTLGGGPSGITYPVANNNDFVSADYSEANFDDIVFWLPSATLYQRMQDAGQLP